MAILKNGIIIGGYPTLSLVYDAILTRGGERGIIYKGKTSGISEELASKYCDWTFWDEYPEIRRYYNYGKRVAVSYPFLTAKESIQSACPQPYCIIMKTFTKLVRPILAESKNKITLNSIAKDPTFGLGIIIEKYGEDCFYNTHHSGGSITTPWERNLGDRLKHYELILISLEDEKVEKGDMFLGDSSTHKYLGVEELDPDNPIKAIAHQSQISPELIQQLIAEYNGGGMKDFEIEVEETYYEVDMGMGEGWESKIVPKLTNGFVTPIIVDENKVI